MASFPAWWTDPQATPTSVAVVAQQAGVLVEMGNYTVGTLALDEEDDEPIGIQVSGSVVAAGGETWLVYPAVARWGGWQARRVHCSNGTTRLIEGQPPRQLGVANDGAEHIVATLLSALFGDVHHLQEMVSSDQLRAATE